MGQRKRKRISKKAAPDIKSRLESFENRFQAHFEKLGDALDRYEKDHPNWQDECLFWLMESSLKRLKSFLCSPKAGKSVWESPLLELKFPVECRWFEEGGEKKFTVNSGRVSETDLETKSSVVKSLTRLMVRQIEITTLQAVTNYAAYSQKGKRYTPMLGQDSLDYLRSLKTDRERGAAITSLLQPCSFGGGTIEFPNTLKPGDQIPKSVAIQLSKIKPPLLSIPFEIDGKMGAQVMVLFEVHPLVVDFSKQTAHYPFIVGLSVLSETVQNIRSAIPPWKYLSELNSTSKSNLWDALLGAAAARLAEFWPRKRVDIEEAIIHVNARIRVRKGEGISLADLPQEALRQLEKVGTVIQFDIRGEGLPAQPLGPEFSSMLTEVGSAKTANLKGKALEKLMVALFSTIKGFKVEAGPRTKTEEIDLFVENGSDEPGLRSEGSVILVECKNWSKKCGKDEYVLFQQKMVNRRTRCTIGFLVSWKGFAKTISLERLRSTRDATLVVLLDGEQVTNAIRDGNFLDCLMKARRDALNV